MEPISLSGSTIHGIFQARILEWVAISLSRRSSPTQGLNPGLPHGRHCRQTLYCLSHQGNSQQSISGQMNAQGVGGPGPWVAGMAAGWSAELAAARPALGPSYRGEHL